jgi:drug/metabolite transporter (DMT)-like permease
MLAIYVALIVAEGGNSFFDIFPWALLMAIAATVAFAGALVADRSMARNLLIAAAALYGVLGFVSIFTIGIGFLLAAAAAAVGASKP